MAEHFTECWRHHPVCAHLLIHDLRVKVLALETTLQVERTGHLVAGYPPLYADHFGMPCSDVEPPKITTHSVALPTGNPHFTHHGEEPPSATP